MDNILLIYLFMGGHLGFFHFLDIVINAAMNMGVQIYVWDLEFSAFGVYIWE